MKNLVILIAVAAVAVLLGYRLNPGAFRNTDGPLWILLRIGISVCVIAWVMYLPPRK